MLNHGWISGRTHGATLRRLTSLTLAALAVTLAAAAAAPAAVINFSAADPAANSGPYAPTYQKLTPAQKACPTPSGSAGRAANPFADAVAYASPATAGNFDAVESLAPKSMALGQIVPFEFVLTPASGASGNMQFTAQWLAKTTPGDDFGFDPAYGVYCAFVDSGDAGTSDPAHDAKVTSFSSLTKLGGTQNENIEGTVNLSGVNSGDQIVVEVWVVLKNALPAGGATGVVQSALLSAQDTGNNTKINTGNQTIPLKPKDFTDASADVSVTKTDSPDPVLQGGQLTYTLVAKNNSTDTVANGVVLKDTLDPNTAYLSGTWSGGSCTQSGGVATCAIGALAPGESRTVTIVTTVADRAPYATDPSSNPETGGYGSTCPAGSDLCNKVVETAVTGDPTPSNSSYEQPTNVLASPPAITTIASGGGALGSSVSDTAKLAGGPAGAYNGTITYRLYSDNHCGTLVASVSNAFVTGAGSYASPSYTPTAAGTYYWVASFQSLTANVASSAAADCADPSERVVIAAPGALTPTVSTTASAGGALGTGITDTAALAGGPAGTYAGTLTFRLYANSSCTEPAAATVTRAVTAGNGSYQSPSVTPAHAGSYWWVASFASSTGGVTDSGQTACDDAAEKVALTKRTATISTTASAGGAIGTAVHDVAKLDGAAIAGAYGGTITYKLYANSTCSGAPIATVATPVAGNGFYTSPDVTPAAAGSYWWVASFASASGDVTDAAPTSCADPAEKVVITAPKVALSTTASPGGPLGTAIHDTATLANGPAAGYTGTLTFRLYGNDSCAGTPLSTDTVAVGDGNGDYDSATHTPSAEGSYWWVASFASNDPDAGTPDPSACNDPAEKVRLGSPSADLELVKTADKATADLIQAAPGRQVTYTFSVTNHGTQDAHNVTIKDPLPHVFDFVGGDGGCSASSGLLTCAVGIVPAGATATRHVTLALNASYDAAAPETSQTLNIDKVEAYLAVPAGATSDASLACPSGSVMTDGSARTDSVDQDTGSIDLVQVIASHTDPANDGRWIFRVANGTTGQAQLHLFGVCVARTATPANGPAHQLQVSAPVTAVNAWDAGRHAETLGCPAGQDAIAAGYEMTSGSGRQTSSEPSADGRTWALGFDLDGPATVQTSIRCLDERTTTDGGQFGRLTLTHAYVQVTVPPTSDASSQPYGDYRVSCPVGAKGIVATYDLPDGLEQLGSTPEPINRDFRLRNTTDHPITGVIDLVCLGLRIDDFGNSGSIINTAWVLADERDFNQANNASSFTIGPPQQVVTAPAAPAAPDLAPPAPVSAPDSVATPAESAPVRVARSAAGLRVSAAGDSAAVTVTCAAACSGVVQIVAPRTSGRGVHHTTRWVVVGHARYRTTRAGKAHVKVVIARRYRALVRRGAHLRARVA